jgi:hypothetical protein
MSDIAADLETKMKSFEQEVLSLTYLMEKEIESVRARYIPAIKAMENAKAMKASAINAKSEVDAKIDFIKREQDRGRIVGEHFDEHAIPIHLKDKIIFLLKEKGRAVKRSELDKEMEYLNNGNPAETRNAMRKLKDKKFVYSISINNSKKKSYWALKEWFIADKLASEYLPLENGKPVDHVFIRQKNNDEIGIS